MPITVAEKWDSRETTQDEGAAGDSVVPFGTGQMRRVGVPTVETVGYFQPSLPGRRTGWVASAVVCSPSASRVHP